MHVPAASASDQVELQQYRDVSRMAILALVLGLASPLALAHPLLWIVPLGGALLAIAALLTISRRNRQLAGRGLATLGLLLALFFGAWSIGQVTLRSRVLQSQARQLADHWLSQCQSGRWEAAHQLTMSATDRQPPGADLEAYYAANPVSREALDAFFAMPPRRWLKQLAERGGEVRFITVEFHTQESITDDQFVLLYELTIPNEEAVPIRRRMRVVVARSVYAHLDLIDWRIGNVTDPNAQPL